MFVHVLKLPHHADVKLSYSFTH